MATWKKLILEGSNISELTNDSGFITSTSGALSTSGGTLTGNLGIPNKITHNDDTGTYLAFTDGQIDLKGSGGVRLIISDNEHINFYTGSSSDTALNLSSDQSATFYGDITVSKDDGFVYLNNAGTANDGVYVRGLSTDHMRYHVPAGKTFHWEIGGVQKAQINTNGLQIGDAGNDTDTSLRVNTGIIIHKDSGTAGNDVSLTFDRRHDGANAYVKCTAGDDGAYATNLSLITKGHNGSAYQHYTGLTIDDEGRALIQGGTPLTAEGVNKRLKIHGSGDNYVLTGCYDDNGWGYFNSYNNANGMQFYIDAGIYSFRNGKMMIGVESSGTATSANLFIIGANNAGDGIKIARGGDSQNALDQYAQLNMNQGTTNLISRGGTSGEGTIALQTTSDGSTHTNRLFVNSNGNIAIGTDYTSPDTLLHIHKASAGSITGHSYAQLVVENSGVTAINLLSATTSHGMIQFGDSDDADKGVLGYDQSTDKMYIRVNGSNDKAFIIDSQGNMGLGLTPDSTWLSTRTAFQIGGTGSIFGRTTAGSGGDITIGQNVYQHSGGSYRRLDEDTTSMYRQYAGCHEFKVAGSSTDNSTISYTDALKINNDANVGIGRTALGTAYGVGAGSILEIGSSATDKAGTVELVGNTNGADVAIGNILWRNEYNYYASGVNYWGGSGEGVARIQVSNVQGSSTGGEQGSEMTFWTKAFGGDCAKRITINSTGNVGIGVSPNSPAGVSRFLHIGHTSHAGIVLDDTDATAWEIYNTNAKLFFYNEATSSNVLTLSSGNVGIGDTSPTEGKLVVSGVGTAGEPALHINISRSDTFNHFTNMINPSLASGENGIIVFGLEASTKNSAWIGYKHRSNAGDDNQLSLGFWGANNLVNLLPNGNLGIGGEEAPIAKCHIFTGDSGHTGSPDVGADELLIEGSGDAGLSFFTPADKKGGIYWSRAGQNTAGSINYHHVNDGRGSNSMIFTTASATALTIDGNQKATFTGDLSVDGAYPFMINASADWKGTSSELNMPFTESGTTTSSPSTGSDLKTQMTWVAPFATTLRAMYVTSETAVTNAQFKVEVASTYSVFVNGTATTTTTYTKSFTTGASANISCGLSIAKGNALRFSINPNSTAVDQFLVTFVFE